MKLNQQGGGENVEKRSGDNGVKEEACKEYLKCIFTEDEKKEMGSKLAQCFQECAEAEGRLKSVTTQIKSEIAFKEAEMASLAEKVRSGYEHRNVDCKKKLDYRLGTVTIARLDTGEVIREKPMDAEERQMSLI